MSTSRYGSPASPRVEAASRIYVVPLIAVMCLLLAACSPLAGLGGGSTTPTTAVPTHISPQPSKSASASTTDTCPAQLGQSNCVTPYTMRVAYGVESLIERGFTGKGQTVIDIVSFGSPTLQHDVDVFDQQFGLPPIKIQIISPINEKEADPYGDKPGWGEETTLDVEIIHALAPDAGIVVLTSPVAETEGTFGLPEFRQLVQYTVDHHLGNIISNSWGASEATLNDPAGQQEIQKWDTLLRTITTQQGITFFAASGDEGASEYIDQRSTKLASKPTISFPGDDPWVTAVGGTTLLSQGQSFQERAWSASGGGFSAFYATPAYQQTLPASVESLFKNRRGVPDVAADADPNTAMVNYVHGDWTMIGGTSASTPVWAALGAIANQLAGHPLGFINPGLYKVAMSSSYTQAFHDITVGNNSIHDGSINVKGYAAAPGWDAVTGLGSANATVLLPALIQALKQ
jgi:subtilase family serine protease